MFSMMIVIFHAKVLATNGENPLFLYGAIGVEFFFITSGYLMTKKALSIKKDCSNIGEETFEYIWKKIKAFFPYVLIAFIISLLVKNEYYSYKKNKIINSVWALLFIDMGGIKRPYILEQTWYISAMLISMIILYPLIRRYKRNFIYIVSPLIVIILGGWLSYTYGDLRGPFLWTGIVYKGILRAFFELALGAIVYEFVNKIKNVNFTKHGKVFLTIIEVLGFVSIFIITNLNNASKKYDFIMLAILAISIGVAFSEKTMFYKISNNKFCYYLEKLSLPIYLNHLWIITILSETLNKNLKELSYINKLGITIIGTIIVSIITMYIIELVKKHEDKLMKLIKRIFVNEA